MSAGTTTHNATYDNPGKVIGIDFSQLTITEGETVSATVTYAGSDNNTVAWEAVLVIEVDGETVYTTDVWLTRQSQTHSAPIQFDNSGFREVCAYLTSFRETNYPLDPTF